MVLLPIGNHIPKNGRYPRSPRQAYFYGRPTVQRIEKSDTFHLAITPEGTRKANPNWKKGFYYIALKAQVPIMLIGIDYPSKTISSTKAVMPTGDIEKDMREIKLYFKNFKGKNPENFDLGNI